MSKLMTSKRRYPKRPLSTDIRWRNYVVPTKWLLRFLEDESGAERDAFYAKLLALKDKGRIKFNGD